MTKLDRCPVCGGLLTGFVHVRIKDGQKLCRDCSVKASRIDCAMRPFQAPEDIREYFAYLEENRQLLQIFRPTQEIATGNGYFRLDENRRLWCQTLNKGLNHQALADRLGPLVYRCDEIVNYELQENGASVTTGGLGRAAIGGALFGGSGAIVGGVTAPRTTQTQVSSLTVAITLNNRYAKRMAVEMLSPGMKYKSGSAIYADYKTRAYQLIALLDVACLQPGETAVAPFSPADEILKYKGLLDDGIITQEEFEAKKRQLLNL